MAYRVERCLLSEQLRKNDISQTELAYLLGVRVQQINKYVLNKQKMSIEVAKNISYILGCQIEELYEWTWIEASNNE